MKLTFLSNYINHHQIPFSDACFAELGVDYAFIQTSPMEAERLAMGWSRVGEERPYVRFLYREEEACRRLIMESDILLAGWTDREDLIEARLRVGRLTVRISERLYREGRWKALSPRGLWHKFREHIRYRRKPVYLLCAGAFVAADFRLIGAYPGKMFRWGYFPETVRYGEELWDRKNQSETLQIIWAGRFIPLKRPEYMIQLARDLQLANYRFHLHMAGSGELEGELKRLAAAYQVSGRITFHGFCPPEQVREIMAASHIHVFTSNHLEGWGAVVNEAMNSGCAEVAGNEAGAVPYLIENGKNGLIFDGRSYQSLFQAVTYLADHPAERERLGREAYRTVTETWNAEQAAGRLLRFLRDLQAGKIIPEAAGPLSTAPVIWTAKQNRQNRTAARYRKKRNSAASLIIGFKKDNQN